MRSRPVIIGALIACALATAGPSAAPRGGQEEPAETPRRIGTTEKVQVNLVLVDVVVRDRRDRPVSGLERDDFELLVDRLPTAPGDIETFEEICAPTASGAGPAPGTPQAGAPAGAAQATDIRHIMMYYDFSQLSLSGRRQALRSTRDNLPSLIGQGDEVMIFAFKDGLRLVQDFTSDLALLESRIDEMIASNATHDLEIIEEASNMADIARSGAGRRQAAAAQAAREEFRARRSLEAIEELMPALEGLGGRKAFVLFTDVLRAEPGAQFTVLAGTTPLDEGISLADDMLRLTREANAAGVSFYTVHASGLDEAQMSMSREFAAELLAASRVGLDAALSLQTTLAAETGGKALQRTNDVGRIIDTARRDLSCYYMLGYRHASVGDGQRHSMIVRVLRGPGGESPRGLTVRYRPYFTDQSPEDRRDRLMRSALAIPDLYQAFPVTTEAFALAPAQGGRRVLLKLVVPIDRISLLPSGPEQLGGSLLVRGEITMQGDTRCSFDQTLPIALERSGGRPTRLVFETGCVLEPGAYDLSVAVMDNPTREIGARRAPVAVPEAATGGTAYVSDVHLWTRDPDTLLFARGADSIGVKEVNADRTGFVPQAERRIEKNQESMLTFLFCPDERAWPAPGRPVRIHRTLLGEADAVVAGFRDLLIEEPPEIDTGCYQIINGIPARSLGDGIYRLTIDLRGSTLGSPVAREAAFVVD